MAYEFSRADVAQIEALGLTVEAVNDQLMQYKMGYPQLAVISPLKGSSHLFTITEQSVDAMISTYLESSDSRMKFVPSSGAASRMFRPLYDYLERSEYEGSPFVERLSEYPFAQKLALVLGLQNLSMHELDDQNDYAPIIAALLDEGYLGFANRPKMLIPFHRSKEAGVRTALEEHMVEGALYAKNRDRSVHLHFTILPEHEEEVRAFFESVRQYYEGLYGVSYVVTWSLQDPATSVIAVGEDLTPYRTPQGELLFRPAGHGALLPNLQMCDADIIFIKNIDNVCPDRLKSETVRFQSALGGVLIKHREEIYAFLRQLDRPSVREEDVDAMLEYCRKVLLIRMPAGVKDAPLASKKKYLRMKLNRPLRVCGLVRNDGAHGGGPFWVRERDGSETIQIVEASQLDLHDPRIEELVDEAEYFNPVLIACSIRNYKGGKFTLSKYVNRNAGMISHKTVGSDRILALELPGLWNGSMAEWNSIFVEVPPITFTPVKELHDLIREEHRG